ncbi:putative transposase orfA for insertion sequence element [Oscillibacter valericigenes Sjm18-20]|nr:putative transposase orfA for insertion sequence element [Oscillibacter valericigenes Sjm18-20]
MRKYDKEFKEEAVKLSDEIGVKQAAAHRQRHSPRRAAFRERAPADEGNHGTAESQ